MKRAFLALIPSILMMFSSTSSAAPSVWLVKCGQSASEAEQAAVALRSRGVNVRSTATEAGSFRNDLCGSSGLLLAFYVRESDVIRAKNADALLKDSPAGYPPKGRKVH